jgi:hypothetical protein
LERAGGSIAGFAGGLRFIRMRDLKTISVGRPGRTLLTGSVLLEENPEVETATVESDLLGLPHLLFITHGDTVRTGTGLRLEGNPKLRSVAVGRMVSRGNVTVRGNDSLQELRVGAGSEILELRVEGNASLPNLDGIPCGTVIRQRISIRNNPSMDLAAVQGMVGCWVLTPLDPSFPVDVIIQQ